RRPAWRPVWVRPRRWAAACSSPSARVRAPSRPTLYAQRQFLPAIAADGSAPGRVGAPGAVNPGADPEPGLELLERRRPVIGHRLGQIAPTAAVEEPAAEVTEGGLDALFPLERLEQVA